MIMKKVILAVAALVLAAGVLTGCGGQADLYIYNWGEYIGTYGRQQASLILTATS